MVVVEVSSVEPRSNTRHFSKNLSIIERLCGPPRRSITVRSAVQPPSMQPHFESVNSGTCRGEGVAHNPAQIAGAF